jgi:murein DD-endopeptidase MepM/ murein hydrolase activator NlpD
LKVLSCAIAVPASKVAATPSATPLPSVRPAPPAAPVELGVFRLNRPAQQGGYALGWAPKGTVRLVIEGADVRFAADGRFGIGFGRDHQPTATITAFLADGRAVTDKISVAPRQWRIENLKTLRRFSQPSAEFQARRPGELAQINAARRMVVDADGWRQKFIWPAKGRISGVFGSQRIYAGEPGAPHNGVDVAGGTGAPVYAPANGIVTLAAASPFTLEGNLLMIDHGGGLNSAFLHLSRIDVKKGDVVRQGQLLGTIGATGRATGPHLHWGMKWNEERIDPQTLAGPMSAP